MTARRIPHDALFKALISTFFEDFMMLFFPAAARRIDFSHVRFLSGELWRPAVEGGNRSVDLVVETKLKGEDGLVLVHVETQNYPQERFHELMFVYYARLFERYRRRILPVAVFGYEEMRREPDRMKIVFPFLKVLRFQFYTLELKRENWRRYARADNPVAAALLAKMGYRPEERTQVRLVFLRMMARLGLDEEQHRLVTGFFETYMPMKEEEEAMFRKDMELLDPEEKKAVLGMMTYWEKKGFQQGLEHGIAQGIEQGLKRGRQEGLLEAARRLLTKGLSASEVKELTGLSDEEMARLTGGI